MTQVLRATVQSTDYTYILDIEIVPLQPDWTLLIEDIHQREWPYLRIANAVGAEWSTFQKWKTGSPPGFSYGHALIILHTKVCGTRLTEQRFIEFSRTQKL